ncbi:unnamed protein product, partial [marine sediment metagenome]
MVEEQSPVPLERIEPHVGLIAQVHHQVPDLR